LNIKVLKYCANAIIVSSFLLAAGCIYQGDIIASNGYSIECDKGRNCIVASQGHISVVIEPEVDKYAVVNQYLIGHTVIQNNSLPPGIPAPIINQQPGYFIVNTQSGFVESGLNEALWRTKLSGLNIENPQLQNTGYDAKNR